MTEFTPPGSRVDCTAGLTVEVTHGMHELPELPHRAPRVLNVPGQNLRRNAPQPATPGPAEVFRLGHVVLQRQEFARNANWYVPSSDALPVSKTEFGELVLEALNMAIGQRRPRGIVHHSDQGTQYTSIEFGLRCKEAKVQPSMGTRGDAYDNAMCESFFATLECELFARRRFATKAQARMAIFEFIEGWYNPTRRHKGLGQISPIEFERRHSMHSERAVTHRPARSVAREAPRAQPVDNRL